MKIKKNGYPALLSVIFFVLVIAPNALAGRPDDRDALQGVTSGKALFDINLAQAEKLPLYLQVIRMTHEGLTEQGITPNFVVAFRGPAVQFVTTGLRGRDQEQAALMAKIAGQIRDLKGLGVRFEACAIATGLFNIDNGDILPEVKVVGNTFNSLIGYQAKGYTAIPIM